MWSCVAASSAVIPVEPGVREMSKRTVYVYHYLPHVRAREGCVKIISQQYKSIIASFSIQ